VCVCVCVCQCEYAARFTLACGSETDNSSRIKMAPELKHALVVIWDQLTKLRSNYLNH